MPFLELKRDLARALAGHFNRPEISAEALEQDFSTPPGIEMGHIALPCFRFAKLLRKGADQIARDLAAHSFLPDVTGKPAGPYVNFRWNPAELAAATLSKITAEGTAYGTDASGKGKPVVLEYCSPNIAKRLAFQHIRSTLIGNVLANTYEALGYETERINFVGDWGSQFARLLAAVELWGDQSRLSPQDVEASMRQLFELYVRFHKEIERDESLGERASKCLQALEAQEPSATQTWKTVRDISLSAMEVTLRRMHVRFDHVEGESAYIPAMAQTLEEIKKKAGARLSEGAWIVEVEGQSTPALVQKRDGTTLYLTRDIAAAADRASRFSFERMIYVVSEQQKLHFQLLFGVLKKMGHVWADKCEHVSFGTVLFGAEKMSTREGRVIFLDDLLNEAKALALKEVTEKNPELKDKEAVAEAVGIGALLFGEFSAHRNRDIEFDWKSILALDGETGPYVQYSAVRCSSLLEKAADKGLPTANEIPPGYELSGEEESLLLSLSRYRSVLHSVVRENEPFYLTRYLIEVAKGFNRFYYKFPVLQAADPAQMQARLALVRATRQVLANGLDLLGITCPREM